MKEGMKVKKKAYEVIISSYTTGLFSTKIINTISLDKAIDKAEKLYYKNYYIHDVHENVNKKR